jgi:hypothetical protein
MQDTAVLHAGALAHPDPVHVTADGGLGPDGNIVRQFHIAEYDCAGINQYPLADARALALEAAQAGGGVVSHNQAAPLWRAGTIDSLLYWRPCGHR